MVKILLGSPPSHYWTVGGNKTRETEPKGEGWELFVNYLVAKEKFNPDFFIFENSKSISDKIKQEITKTLKCEPTMIDSALVSAQSRKRLYWHNINGVELPEHTNKYVKDIIKPTVSRDDVTYIMKHLCKKPQKSSLLNPIRIGDIKNQWQDHRIYSPFGKSVTLKCDIGGKGAKTGLYLCPIDLSRTSCENVHYVANGKMYVEDSVFDVKDIPNGQYVIRSLTLQECCRLQTLPDNYCKDEKKNVRYVVEIFKCLGDAWTANVIMHILNFARIPRDEEVVVLSLYDGIGVGRYCLDAMGYENVKYYSYEINKTAVKIANRNYPDIIQCGNAFQARENEWKLEKKREDGII